MKAIIAPLILIVCILILGYQGVISEGLSGRLSLVLFILFALPPIGTPKFNEECPEIEIPEILTKIDHAAELPLKVDELHTFYADLADELRKISGGDFSMDNVKVKYNDKNLKETIL